MVKIGDRMFEVGSRISRIRSLKRAMFVVGAVAVLSVSCGFLIERSSFLPSLLAEMGGFAAGAVVTYVIIDGVLVQERRRRFGPVRQATIRVLRRHLTEIALQYPMIYPPMYSLAGTSTEGFSEHAEGQVRYMERVITAGWVVGGRAYLNQWDKSGSRGPNDFAIELHDKVRGEIDGILDRAYPRVLEIGDMPKVTAALAALEQGYSEWWNQIIIEKEVVAGAPYEGSIRFLERVRDAYASLREEEL